jgi:eukaryotic-like serine/threonine-protein kinase
LKPANILVTPKRSINLLDLGLARLRSLDEQVSAMTAVGTVMGTSAYMSPEQAQGVAMDERSDVFSFGSVLYELLSGRRAFECVSCSVVEESASSTSEIHSVATIFNLRSSR